MAGKRKTIHMVLLPLRGLMIFPHMVLHFDVGRPKSIASLEAAMLDEQRIFLVAQKDADTVDPEAEDLYEVGTIAHVKQVLNLPGDTLRVLVEGEKRATLKKIDQTEPFWLATVTPEAEQSEDAPEILEALVRTARDAFENYAHVSQRISEETIRSVSDVKDPGQLADVIAANVLGKIEERQAILEEMNVVKRLETLCGVLARESELAGLERQVQGRVRSQIDKNQKEYYLREQMRAIQEELGESDSTAQDEIRKKLK